MSVTHPDLAFGRYIGRGPSRRLLNRLPPCEIGKVQYGLCVEAPRSHNGVLGNGNGELSRKDAGSIHTPSRAPEATYEQIWSDFKRT